MTSVRWGGLVGLLLRAALPIGILSVGGLSYFMLSVEQEQEKSPPAEEQALRTRVIKLRVQDYPVVVETHGIVQPHNEVMLSAQVSGQIRHVSAAFEVGSYFSKGDVLIELDSRDYETALAVAEAQRLGAESALQLATKNLERNMKLFERKGISEAEVNLASATQAQAAAELDSAVSRLEQAERDLERTKITAPFDGRVRQKLVGLGQTVGPGTVLGQVFAIDFAEVRLPIAGRELQFLTLPERTGDTPVDVELRDAINESIGTVWKAKIVRTEGALDVDSLELFAIARIDDPFGIRSGHPPLRIGQPVVASIAGKVLTDVVALPRAAVRQLDQINLVDSEKFTLMPMTIEPVWSDENVVIVEDPSIRDGDLLSTTHIVYAPEGAKVEIIPEMGITTATAKTATGSNVEPVAN